MAIEPTHTFYTYSMGNVDCGSRWRNDGINDIFFLNASDARRAAAEAGKELARDPETGSTEIRIEKVKTVQISSGSLMSLLNGDLASFIESYEIIDSFFTSNPAPHTLIG